MNTERVEAAAKAAEEASESLWTTMLDDSDRQPYWRVIVRAALAAADSASGEKVVYANQETIALGVMVAGFRYGIIAPGEELVVRKVRTV